MTRPNPARDEILGRIRTALNSTPTEPGLPWQMGLDPPPGRTLDSTIAAGNLMGAFRNRLQVAGGTFHLAWSPVEATDVIREIALDTGARRVLHSDHPLVKLRTECMGDEFEWVSYDDDREELLSCDLGLTTANWGVAETGTIVLVSAAEHHRLASLLPPVHVALLDSACLVPTLDDLFAEVHDGDPDSLSRTITMITGPSRTADIELELAVGVHGPREVHVILLEHLEVNLP